MTTPTDNLLSERGKTHGAFNRHAHFTQELKGVMAAAQQQLTASQQEALDMIAHKIGRILAGNPDFADHWDDIAGYARLISLELTGNPQ